MTSNRNKGIAARYPSGYAPQPVSRSVETYRTRTPAEVVDDAYLTAVEVTALNTVTHLAYDSIKTIAQHKAQVMAETPEAESALDALAFNHVQGLLNIQRQVTENVRKELR